MGKVVKYIFLIPLFFLSCTTNGNEMQLAPYEKYVNEIVNSCSRKLAKEYGLICVGSGGRMPNDVEEIDLSLQIYQHATIDEARELFVKATEKLLDEINKHEKIRPYLREYPFTFKIADKVFSSCRAHISISFLKKDGSHYRDGSAAFVCNARGGKISYSSVELQKKKLPDYIELDGKVEVGEIVEQEIYVDVLKEPYEEALKIVEKTK